MASRDGDCAELTHAVYTLIALKHMEGGGQASDRKTIKEAKATVVRLFAESNRHANPIAMIAHGGHFLTLKPGREESDTPTAAAVESLVRFTAALRPDIQEPTARELAMQVLHDQVRGRGVDHGACTLQVRTSRPPGGEISSRRQQLAANR